MPSPSALKNILKRQTTGKRYQVTHHTADATLTPDSGVAHTNFGAAAVVTLTLSADFQPGAKLIISSMDADDLDIAPQTLAAFFTAAGKATDGKKLQLDNIGDSVTIMNVGSNDWMVIGSGGTVGVEA
jgi:hypothetical protein